MPVIVTRPQPEAAKWALALTEAGHEAIALPLIGVGPAPDAVAVVDAWQRLAQYDAVMFVSGNAVAHFFALKPAMTPVFSAQSTIKTRAFVTGPGTRTALLREQAEGDWIDAPNPDAGQFDSEALWEAVKHRVGAGYRVLIVRGAREDQRGNHSEGAGRDWFASQVLSAGGTVDFVAAYQRVLPQWRDDERNQVAQWASDGSVWLLSSSEAIQNLLLLAPQQSWKQARAVASHPRIANAARNAGFAVVCESRPTLAAMVASIESMQ